MTHADNVEKFFEGDTQNLEDLNNALYAVSELGLWPDDIDSVSEEQTLFCWRIIEKLKVAKFPKELSM